MQKPKRAIIDVFDNIADQCSWEQLYAGKLNRVSYNFVARQRAVEELLQPYATGSTLDIGCGSGDLCPFFVEKGVLYLGLDLSSKMIERANANYRAFVETGRTRFQVADCEALPFGSGKADIVTAVALLEYLPDPSRSLDEIARVTRRGGYAILTLPHKFCINSGIRIALSPLINIIFPIYQLIKGHPLTTMRNVKHYSYNPSGLDRLMRERNFEKET